MLVVWGKNVKFKTFGYAADFCPMCREICCFALNSFQQSSHVYYVEVGGVKELFRYRTCTQCGIDIVDYTDRYKWISPGKMGLPELIPETFPNIHEHYKDRLALEHRLINEPESVTATEKLDLFFELLSILELRVTRTLASKSFLSDLFIQMLLCVVAIGAGPFLASMIDSNYRDQIYFGLIGITFVFGVYQTFRVRKQRVLVYFLRRLILSMRPLNLTPEQIELGIERAKTNRLRISKYLVKDVILSKLAEPA